MNYYIEALKKYATFKGRASRSEYWFFTLFTVLISIALMVVDIFTGSFDETAGMGVLSGIYTLAVLLPSLAVLVRRLHDTNRSGWWFFISLIPLIGPIVLLVFLVQGSKDVDNNY